ncbi:MAG: hypothetical protein JST40_01160 [Armatimonadetes bacterium]|nr:hypothetical protein [Armatimonadota bacterium]
MKLIHGIVLSIALGASATMAIAADTINIGTGLGVYLPSDRKIRNALGSQWFSIGFRPVAVSSGKNTSMGTDLNFIAREKSGNKLFIGTYTFGTTVNLAEPGGNNAAVPYVSARAGIAYFDYGIGSGASRISKKRFGYDGNVEAGVTVNRIARAYVRYDLLSRHDGFKFDGLTLGVEISLGRF